MRLKTLHIVLLLAISLHAPILIRQNTLSVLQTVMATMYNASISQCDSTPFVTAGMYRINPDKASQHKWVALSRDLLSRWGGKFNYGDLIRVSGAGHKNGIYKVVDTMNKRFKNRMDFLETSGTKIYQFDNVVIEKIGV